MAPSKVFGNPITNETLKAMPEYANKETITGEDRAQVALNLRDNVVKFAEELLEQSFGPGDVKTIGIIYNATGHTLKYTFNHDWCGHVDKSYPKEIENGQFATFLHVGDHPKGFALCTSPKESIGAVAYFANNGLRGGFCNWIFAWYNVENKENKIFTELQAPQVVEQNWEAIREKLESSACKEQSAYAYGFKATVIIGNANPPPVIATITFGGLPPPNA
ncbi:hypothetical protein FEM48_Zijuj04G0145700 [Ziziphus jujuba var. spinosa]|uniref:23 kDa jasmonate-induced protein-like n=1 Tax=Ziziphus jujuba var. spinosa TaxID=714518 RepID=A0A978VKF4_ZIZJJ|nr:hypothetical protein FEM48_Zijuj04G0145700 [Ziziphus jujuba var. spinosa]